MPVEEIEAKNFFSFMYFHSPSAAQPHGWPVLMKNGKVSLIESESGKLIYSFTAEFGGNVTVSLASPLSEGAIEHARSRAQAFLLDGTLAKVANLLIESQELRTDGLRAFIAAWSALEIFISATFKAVYAGRWFEIMSSNAPISAKPYFNHLKSVMDGKHRLADKFLVIASILDSDAAEKDTSDFKTIKSVRDSLFHASESATSLYPVKDTKYAQEISGIAHCSAR